MLKFASINYNLMVSVLEWKKKSCYLDLICGYGTLDMHILLKFCIMILVDVT